MQVKSCIQTEMDKKLIETFSIALQIRDIKKIHELLSEDGVYEIQSPRLNTLRVNKKRLISWIKKRLKQVDQITLSYDQCVHCSIGATVLLINNGTFPRQIKDSSEQSKTGLMIEIENGLISRIKFCYVLLKTENKYMIDLKMERIKHYIDKGHSFWSANQKAEKELLEQKD